MENEYLEKLYRNGTATPMTCLECGEMMVRTQEMHPANPPIYFYLCKNEHAQKLTDEQYIVTIGNQLWESRADTIAEAKPFKPLKTTAFSIPINVRLVFDVEGQEEDVPMLISSAEFDEAGLWIYVKEI